MRECPRGEKRPADAVGRAVMAGGITSATPVRSAAAELGRRGGKKCAENMTPERRAEIARKAAEERWAKR